MGVGAALGLSLLCDIHGGHELQMGDEALGLVFVDCLEGDECSELSELNEVIVLTGDEMDICCMTAKCFRNHPFGEGFDRVDDESHHLSVVLKIYIRQKIRKSCKAPELFQLL